MAVHGAHLRDTPKKELVSDDVMAVESEGGDGTNSYFDLYGCSREVK